MSCRAPQDDEMEFNRIFSAVVWMGLAAAGLFLAFILFLMCWAGLYFTGLWSA